MHGYILNGRVLVCQHVPEAHVHDRMFVGALTAEKAAKPRRSLGPNITTTREVALLRHNKEESTALREKRREKRLREADETRRKRLKKKGIDYEFPGYTGSA